MHHLAENHGFGRIYFVAPENANGIEWLKSEVSITDQQIGQVKVDRLGVKIRGDEADNLCMSSGLGEQVPITVEHVAEAHAVRIGHAAGTRDMALQIDDTLAIGQDRFDANAIPILYLKRIDRIAIGLRTLLAGKIQRDCLALAVGIDALDGDVASAAATVKPPESSRSAASEVSPAFTS
jgi:hypothetical protein